MNIFIREIKAHRKSLILWCLGMIFMVGAGMAKFSGYSSAGGQSVTDIVSRMPKILSVILGFDSLDVTKVSGYFGVIYSYLVIMAGVHSSMLGAGIIAKEERDKTSEFLFTKPVTRNKVISAKLAAAFLNIVIMNLVTMVSSVLFCQSLNKGPSVTPEIIKLILGMFILQVVFLLSGTALAAWSKRPKNAASKASGFLLVVFVLYKAIDLNSKLEFLKYVTPFKYFDAKDILSTSGFEPIYFGLSALIVVITLIITFTSFKKRDLNI